MIREWSESTGPAPFSRAFKRRQQKLANECAFTRATDARDDHQAVQGKPHREVLQVVGRSVVESEPFQIRIPNSGFRRMPPIRFPKPCGIGVLFGFWASDFLRFSDFGFCN